MESLEFGILENFGNGNRDEENINIPRVDRIVRIWNTGKFFKNFGYRD